MECGKPSKTKHSQRRKLVAVEINPALINALSECDFLNGNLQKMYLYRLPLFNPVQSTAAIMD